MREFHPEPEKLFSWWSYRAQDWRASNRGRRLDHIWVTPALRAGLRSIAILRRGARLAAAVGPRAGDRRAGDLTMRLVPQVLENAFVRLEPLDEAHREALRDAAEADRDIWANLYPYSMIGEHFEPFWDRARPNRPPGA